MIDYQAIVDEIRNALMFSETAAPETLRRLADRYADACGELNERLQSCARALRQGNVAEAVRLAEMEPNLLDVYTILDFPEREEWGEVAATLAFAVPPPFLAEQARELNDAYASQNALEPFLKRYRLAALARAPLAERIALLREISQAEPQNIAWNRDRESLERVRLETLDAEVKEAVKSNNLLALNALQNELSQQWVVAPPQHLLEQVELVLRSNRLKLVEKEMRKYAERLVQAHMAFDHGKSMVLYEKIMQLQKQYRFSVPDDLVQLTRGAVAWLQEENRRKKDRLAYRAAHEAMLNSLKAETPPAELQRLADRLEIAASDAETTIPEETVRAVENEIEMRELQRRRKSRLVTFVIVAACLFALGLTSLFVYSFAQYRKTRETIATLEQLKTEASPQAIRAYLAGKDAELAASNNEEIAALLASLRDITTTDDRRIAQFEAKCGQLSDLLESDTIDSPTTLARFESLLRDIERLAQTAEERRTLETLRGRQLQKSREFVKDRDADLVAKMQSVQERIAAIVADRELPPEETIGRYRKLMLELEAADNANPNASANNREHCRNMIKRLQERIDLLESQQAVQERVGELRQLIGVPDAYRERLAEIASQFPDREAGRQFQRAADEFAGVKLLVDYGVLCEKLAAFRIESELAPREAREIMPIGDVVLQYFTDVGELSLDVGLLNAVKCIANRPTVEEPKDDLFANTKELLTGWRQKPAWPLYRATNSSRYDEPWYYVTAKPEKVGTYNYLKGGDKTERKHFGNEFFSDRPKDRPTESHVEFADQALDMFERMTQKNWTENCVGLLTRLQQANGIDPIRNYQLLKTMLREFAECDSTVNRNYGSMLLALNDPAIDRFDRWGNVESADTIMLRKKAAETLAALKWPDVSQVALQYRELVDGIGKNTVRFQWVGFLNRDVNGWRLERNLDDPLTEGELLIVRSQNADAERYSLIRVGQVVDDHQVQLFDMAQMLQGSPVFLKTTNTKTID